MKTLFVLMLFLSTCVAQKGSGDSDSEKEAQNNGHGLIFVAGDTYSGREAPETLIITEAKSLQKFYAHANRTRKPGLPVPDIDFSKEVVIVRCSGISRDDALPKLYVMEVKEDIIVLGIRESEKKPTSTAATTAFAVYKMPHSEKEISIEE